MKRTHLCGVSILLLLIAGAPGCAPKKAVPADPAPGSGTDAVGLTTVASRKVPVYIEATGTVQPDLDGGARVTSPVSGVVSGIAVKIGERVRRGQPLMTIRSPEISDASASYLSTSAQLQQAERVYRLDEKLLEVGAVTRNDFLNSEAAYEQLKASAEGLKRKLDLNGVDPASGFTDEMVIRSPLDGVASDISAHLGDRFEASASLAYVLCPDRVVIVANLYDTDVSQVRTGEVISFTTDVAPEAVFSGRVTYISGAEDPEAKTVKTYIRPGHPEGLFKQNMFLKIKILASERTMPVVAKTCLLYKDGRFYVFVRRGETFERRPVSLRHEISEELVAVDGLRDGDRIATSAIDLEGSL